MKAPNNVFDLLMKGSREQATRERVMEEKHDLSLSQIDGSFIYDNRLGTQLLPQIETFSIEPNIEPCTFASQYAAHVQCALTPARTSTPRCSSLPRMSAAQAAHLMRPNHQTPKRYRSPTDDASESEAKTAKTLEKTATEYDKEDDDVTKAEFKSATPEPAAWRQDPIMS